MFVVWDLMLALAVGLVLTLVFAVGLRRRGPWASVVLFFLIVFLGSWAAGVWVGPRGPALWGVHWLPALMFGLALALLLAAAFPAAPPRRSRREQIELERKGAAPAVVAIDAFFVVLLVLLVAFVLFGYVR